MLFYDLPLDIKKLVLSYSLGDVKLLKINNSNIVKTYINKYKPVYKSYTLNNIHYFEIDNININNGLSYVVNLSELDKLHKKYKPLKIFIEYDALAIYSSLTHLNHVCNRTLISINLFDIYYFLNKDLHKVKLVYGRSGPVDLISVQIITITIKVINDGGQRINDDFYFYFYL